MLPGAEFGSDCRKARTRALSLLLGLDHRMLQAGIKCSVLNPTDRTVSPQSQRKLLPSKFGDGDRVPYL